jgi:hypothetical protein
MVQGGILARNIASDEQDLTEQKIDKVDYVICNLYPFKDTVAKINVTVSEAVEEIDIGRLFFDIVIGSLLIKYNNRRCHSHPCRSKEPRASHHSQ